MLNVNYRACIFMHRVGQRPHGLFPPSEPYVQVSPHTAQALRNIRDCRMHLFNCPFNYWELPEMGGDPLQCLQEYPKILIVLKKIASHQPPARCDVIKGIGKLYADRAGHNPSVAGRLLHY